MTQEALSLYPGTLAFAIALGLHGKRNGSLSTSGATAATLLGYLTLASPLRLFGVCLLVFYFSGSRATKVKAAYKASLEEDPALLVRNGKPGGNRSAAQVLSNAWFGTTCAVLWRLRLSGETSGGGEWDANAWCAVGDGERESRALVLGALAFWAACAGDTFASELGMLARSQPRLITTLRIVPPGTNGGVTNWGFFVSLLGGLLVGLAGALALGFQNPACRRVSTKIAGYSVPWWVEVVAVGAWAGFAGSLIDSVLGALLQETLYSTSKRKVVHSKERSGDKDKIESIAGVAILSNNAVNVLASGGTAALVALWAHR